MLRFLGIWLLCLAGVAGCQTDEESFVSSGAKPLTAAELQKLYLGNTMSGIIPSQNLSFHAYFHPDGRVAGKLLGGARHDLDWGVYQIKEPKSQVCIHWAKWLNTGCATVYKLGPEMKVFEPREGKLYFKQRMRKGNPEKLALAPPVPAAAK